MRDYGKVYTRFWLTKKVMSWGDSEKLLTLYLLTCPHCNLLGCFRLPVGYVSSDLSWPEDKALATLNELEEAGFMIRCESTGWTVIRNFLRYNPIENPNQGKAAMRLLKDVPRDFLGMKDLMDSLNNFKARLPDEFFSLFASLGGLAEETLFLDSSNEEKDATVKTVGIIEFDHFWELQTRKENKVKAKEEWISLGLEENQTLAREIINRWVEQKDTRLQYQDRTKTPVPHNWLSNRQWEDEYLRTDDAVQANRAQKFGNAQTNIEESNRRIAQNWASPEVREVKSNAGNG